MIDFWSDGRSIEEGIAGIGWHRIRDGEPNLPRADANGTWTAEAAAYNIKHRCYA
jgi:hypothetical protein